jgi:ABC-2 type transport system permease protein
MDNPALIAMGKPPTSMFLKTIRLIPCYFWLSLLRSSEFKFSFYSYIFLYGSQILFYVFFWNAVPPPKGSGWSTEACVLLTGFGTINVSLQELVWATGMLDQMILRGDLSVVLVRPENSYFGLVLRRMGAMALLPASMGLALVLTTLIKTDSLYLWTLAAALTCCLMGSVAMRAVLLVVNTLGFRFGKVTALKSFVYSSRDFSRYPIDILPTVSRTFLCTVFPVMMMSNWPVLISQSHDPRWVGLILLTGMAITGLWIWFCSWFWRRGLRHYEGQSL